MAEGFRQLITRGKGDPWRLFLRYQAQAERQYRRALEEFERLKALRNELPNEPTVDPETEEKIDRFAPSPEPVEDEREPSASSLEEPSPRERQPINGRLIH
jgi:hypothetical protein